MEVKRVLLVEDFPQLQELISLQIKIVFGEDVEIHITDSLQGADELYDKHIGDIDLILLDTHLKNGVTTFKLAKRIAKEFNRPVVKIKGLIAISTDRCARELMLREGCTYQCEKSKLMKFLRKWKEEHEA